MAMVNLLKGWGALMRLVVAATAVCISMISLAGADDAMAAIRKTTSIPAEGLGPALATLAHFHFAPSRPPSGDADI